MNYLRSSASNLASLAGFSASKKLNRSTDNEKKEESLLVVRNITSFVLPNKENDAIEFHRLVSIDR